MKWIACILIAFLTGCSSTSIDTSQAHKWDESYGSGFALTMVGEGFTFPFPNAPGSVHYITKASGPLKIGQTITVTFKITGNATFATVQKNIGKSAFRLMIQRDSDMYTNYGRYWSNPDCFILKNTSQASLIVPITSSEWSDVYGGWGTQHLDEFKKTLEECGNIGITFGGTTGGYGHGVYATGGCTFTLIDCIVK